MNFPKIPTIDYQLIDSIAKFSTIGVLVGGTFGGVLHALKNGQNELLKQDYIQIFEALKNEESLHSILLQIGFYRTLSNNMFIKLLHNLDRIVSCYHVSLSSPQILSDTDVYKANLWKANIDLELGVLAKRLDEVIKRDNHDKNIMIKFITLSDNLREQINMFYDTIREIIQKKKN